VSDFHDIALDGRRVVLAFDSDVATKDAVQRALTELAGYLASKGAIVEYLHLPHTGDGKTGLDDWLAAGHDVTNLWTLVRPDIPALAIPVNGPDPKPGTGTAPVAAYQAGIRPPEPHTWQDVVDTFTRWFGPKFDLDYLAVVLAVTATGLHHDGDPCWLLVVGGAGVGKTEALTATERAGCHVVSTISGPAALLSGTPAVERAKDATGGLLRAIGDRGTLVIKDFTSILSMRRDHRTETLAALREVYDGRWVRLLGAEGGRQLTWTGRATVLGGVTSVYDEHHGVIAAMGDRFLLLRLDSDDDDVRRHASLMAMRNSGAETVMRAALADVVAGFLLNRPTTRREVPADLAEELFEMADLIARSRSQVTADFKGDPEYAHASEMPTRVAKQLVTLWRGARDIGMDENQARALVRRVAHDTIPPGRRVVLLDVHDYPGSTTYEVAKRVSMAHKTVQRRLQELELLHLVTNTAPEVDQNAGRWWPAMDRLPAIGVLRGTNAGPEFAAETSPPAGTEEGEGPSPSSFDSDDTGRGERSRNTSDGVDAQLVDPRLVELADSLPVLDQLPLPSDDPWPG
jgi:hypothetical protein